MHRSSFFTTTSCDSVYKCLSFYPSTYLSLCLFIYSFIYISLSIYLFTFMSISGYLSIYPSIDRSIFIFSYLLLYTLIYQFICQYTYLSCIHLSVDLSINFSLICLSIKPFFHYSTYLSICLSYSQYINLFIY